MYYGTLSAQVKRILCRKCKTIRRSETPFFDIGVLLLLSISTFYFFILFIQNVTISFCRFFCIHLCWFCLLWVCFCLDAPPPALQSFKYLNDVIFMQVYGLDFRPSYWRDPIAMHVRYAKRKRMPKSVRVFGLLILLLFCFCCCCCVYLVLCRYVCVRSCVML